MTRENMQKLTPAEIKKVVVAILKEHKAIDVQALNITKLTDIADYMIICTANSTVHVKTLIDKVCDDLRALHIRPIGVEGEDTREWMLADFGHIIVHVMLEDIRNFYELEKLWGIKKVERKSAVPAPAQD